MDRNSLIGLLLIGGILLIYTFYFAPTRAPKDTKTTDTTHVTSSSPSTQDTTTDTAAPVAQNEQNKTSTNKDTLTTDGDSTSQLAQFKQSHGPFAQVAYKAQQLDSASQYFTIENDNIAVTFSKKGGKIANVQIKGYHTYNKDSLVLFRQDSTQFGFTFYVNNRPIYTNDLYFTTASKPFTISGEDEKSLKLRCQVGPEKYIEYIYTLKGNSHSIDYQCNFVGFQDMIPSNKKYLTLTWLAQLRSLEKGKDQESRYTTLYYKYKVDDEVTYVSDDKAEVNAKLDWVSFKHQFFNSSLINKQTFQAGSEVKAQTSPKEANYLKELSAELIVPYNHKKNTQYQMEFYFSPNKYNQLASKNLYLEEIIPLGWGVFSWINKYFIIPFFNFLNAFIANYGIIILIMTILIKTLLMPLTYKSYKSMAKMKVIKPELEELKEKYKDKPQKFSQAQLKLFRKAGVNPLGGCLPMLLQMPILVAMYRFFPASLELRQENFLWANDLSTYDSIAALPFNIPFYGDHISLFALLMAVSMLAYTRMNSQMTSGAGGGQMKMMQYFMPIFMLFIFNSFAAALTYYFLLSNLFSFGQQYFMKKFLISDEQVHKQIQQSKKKPKKKSKFQKKLEQMTRQAKNKN